MRNAAKVLRPNLERRTHDLRRCKAAPSVNWRSCPSRDPIIEARDMMKASDKAARRSAQKRRHVVAASISVVAVLACLTALTSLWFGYSHSASSEPVALASNGPSQHTGTIIVHESGDHCKEIKFDNDTGKTLERQVRCDGQNVLDSQGVPAPAGTIHRLDAISRSFFGR
jgi:hypothetical protein